MSWLQHFFSLLQEPVPILLGTRTQPGKFLKDGTVKETKDTLVYIPVLKTLEHLLQNEMIVSEVGASKCSASFTIYIGIIILLCVNFYSFCRLRGDTLQGSLRC